MKKTSGILSVLASVVFWGVSFISIKIVLEVVDPILLGFFRYILAVAFVLIFVWAKRISLKVPFRDLIVFFLAGVIGIFLYTSLENTALQFISPQSAAIMSALVPLAILIANTLVFKERFELRYLIYVALSIFGVWLVVSPDATGDTGENAVLGLVLMVFSIVSWTIYALLTKRVVERYESTKVTALQSIMALLAFTPALLFRPFPDFTIFTPTHWFHLLFLGIFCSGVTYLLFVHSIRQLGLTAPNVMLNFIPLVTVLTGAIWFGEAITWIQVLGGVVVVLTMTMITIDRTKSLNAAKQPE
ncbi:MAG: DMT family transporter [Bacillus subtilis]|nr:DMT family transporter [Bacillus subtilis]